MKTKFYFLAAIAFSFLGSANAQTLPITADLVALPSTGCGGTFGFTGTYSPSSQVQLGVNNTGTDVCQDFVSGRVIQAMVWDNVANIVSQTNFTSTVYLSCNFNGAAVSSFSFPGGYDPDVAIWSDTLGTFMEIVFENNTSGKIDGYTYVWNGTTFVPYTTLPFKCTLSNDPTKKAKNPNVTSTKDKGRFAVVWHEEGLVTPPQTLTITYSTTPPVSYTNTVSLLQSRVYIHCIDKPGYLGDLLGSTTSTPTNFPGNVVVRTTPPGTNNLFDRNYNPDVSFSEEAIGSGGTWPTQTVISVVFLSEYFNPATFGIVSDGLSVVQGTMDDFRISAPGATTSTKNFTRTYSGKPRIAARLTLTGTYVAKDFSVVMGNASTAVTCAGSTLSSKLHFWWNHTGSGATSCPTGGVDIISGTPYANNVTTADPVISCINAKGYYAVAFATNLAGSINYDIVANTYYQGALANPGAYSYVNYGSCSASQAGNQAIPSIASFRKPGANQIDNAYSNYLFWDQLSKTLNFKKVTTNNIPGGGVALRQSQNETISKFVAYPNPTDNEILFDFKLEENEIPNEIEIFNMIGQSVDKFSIQENLTEQKRDVNKIPSGTYIAILKTNTKNYSLEFVKK